VTRAILYLEITGIGAPSRLVLSEIKPYAKTFSPFAEMNTSGAQYNCGPAPSNSGRQASRLITRKSIAEEDESDIMTKHPAKIAVGVHTCCLRTVINCRTIRLGIDSKNHVIAAARPRVIDAN